MIKLLLFTFSDLHQSRHPLSLNLSHLLSDDNNIHGGTMKLRAKRWSWGQLMADAMHPEKNGWETILWCYDAVSKTQSILFHACHAMFKSRTLIKLVWWKTRVKSSDELNNSSSLHCKARDILAFWMHIYVGNKISCGTFVHILQMYNTYY